MDGIHRNIADAEIFIEVAIGRNVAAAILDAHFDLKRSAFADGADIDVLVENLDIGIVFDVGGGVDARL